MFARRSLAIDSKCIEDNLFQKQQALQSGMVSENYIVPYWKCTDDIHVHILVTEETIL